MELNKILEMCDNVIWQSICFLLISRTLNEQQKTKIICFGASSSTSAKFFNENCFTQETDFLMNREKY